MFRDISKNSTRIASGVSKLVFSQFFQLFSIPSNIFVQYVLGIAQKVPLRNLLEFLSDSSRDFCRNFSRISSLNYSGNYFRSFFFYRVSTTCKNLEFSKNFIERGKYLELLGNFNNNFFVIHNEWFSHWNPNKNSAAPLSILLELILSSSQDFYFLQPHFLWSNSPQNILLPGVHET